MPAWLKPTYVVIALLLAGLGVQTWRLTSANQDLADFKVERAELVADIAVQREAGVREGVARQRAAQATLDAEHQRIVAGLESDKAKIQRSYDNTYQMLYQLSTQDKFSCLAAPLPEETLKEFRR